MAYKEQGPNDLRTLATHGFVSIIIGIVAGLALGQGVQSGTFWAALSLSALGVFLVIFFVRAQFLTQVDQPEVRSDDQAMLTSSISSSKRSAYAISSNWIGLWRWSTFRYYLHLDAVMSLIAYSSSRASPLERLSTDAADQEAFYDYGWELVKEIGSGNHPLRKHRLRLLIYPQWVYDRYPNEIKQLIRSHSSSRIPCIPLDADKLHELLDPNEQSLMLDLTKALDQSPLDKMPPQSRLDHYRVRREIDDGRYQGQVFPDMLLIDTQTDFPTSSIWWYSSDGHVDHWNKMAKYFNDATSAFEVLCHHAEAAVWPGYAADALGGVVVSVGSKTLDSEAFFAGRYYTDWLQWIRDRSGTRDSARKLNSWLAAEEVALRQFIQQYKTEVPAESALSVLDLGCGTGRHLTELLKEDGDLTAVGIDINSTMINQAILEARRASISPRVVLLIGDISALDECESDEFDLAICMTNTLGNMPGKKRSSLVEKLSHTLKPGGRALFSVYSLESVEARLDSYKGIGLGVEERGSKVLATEGLESEAFSEAGLRNLIERSGLRVLGGVEPVTPLGWKAVAERVPG